MSAVSVVCRVTLPSYSVTTAIFIGLGSKNAPDRTHQENRLHPGSASTSALHQLTPCQGQTKLPAGDAPDWAPTARSKFNQSRVWRFAKLFIYVCRAGGGGVRHGVWAVGCDGHMHRSPKEPNTRCIELWQAVSVAVVHLGSRAAIVCLLRSQCPMPLPIAPPVQPARHSLNKCTSGVLVGMYVWLFRMCRPLRQPHVPARATAVPQGGCLVAPVLMQQPSSNNLVPFMVSTRRWRQ